MLKNEAEKNKLWLIPDLCMSMGINKSLYSSDNQRIISHMPYGLYPYVLKRSTYDRLVQAHEIWQKVIVKMSGDHQFLHSFAQQNLAKDFFMTKFFDIYKDTFKQQQSLTKVACTRIDYMGDDDPKLVEINLMSVGLNGIADRVQQLASDLKLTPGPQITFPPSQIQQTFCAALVECLNMNNLRTGLIVIVVHEKQFNFGDQNAFKMEMMKKDRMVITATMEQMLEDLVVSQETGVACYKQKRVDCFYFRTGYVPKHFPNEQVWELRKQIEASISVKVPSIQMLLINMKAMQTAMSKQSVLQKYISSEEISKLADYHGSIYNLKDYKGHHLDSLLSSMKIADYVLKPNREGGGNNFFGDEALQKIRQFQQDQVLDQYILMKRIEARSEPNIFIAEFDHCEVQQSTAEYSTMGSFVYKQGQEVANKFGGTLVRLKKKELNEGGIAINQAVITGLGLLDAQPE